MIIIIRHQIYFISIYPVHSIHAQGKLFLDRATQAIQRENRTLVIAKRKLNRKIEYSIETVKISI